MEAYGVNGSVEEQAAPQELQAAVQDVHAMPVVGAFQEALAADPQARRRRRWLCCCSRLLVLCSGLL